MATVQRPLKEGSVRTYQAKVGLGYVDILASEMDADLDTIYAAWNGGISTVDLGNGSVTYAKLAPDAQLWQDTGTKLIPGPSFVTRPVLVSGSNNPLEWGALTIKGRLNAHPSQGYYYLSANALLNAGATAWTQDSTSFPSWIATLNTQTDQFLVSRMAAAATIPTPFVTVDATGLLSTNVAGINARTGINWNVANAATGAQGVLETYTTVGVRLGVNDRWNPPAPAQPSWSLEMQAGGAFGTTLFHRAGGAGSGTSDHSFLFNYNGNYIQTGNYAEKSAGTTWANPSDRRLKDDIEDYTTGLAAVCQLHPRTFVYNGKGRSQAGLRGYGFIADEVAPVMPEMLGTTAVKLDPDDEEDTDIQTLDQSNLILALVNAVRELAARVDALEAPA